MDVKVKVEKLPSQLMEEASPKVEDQSFPQPKEEMDTQRAPLTVRVQLPRRHFLLENQVHVLEVILEYGDQERMVLMVRGIS